MRGALLCIAIGAAVIAGAASAEARACGPGLHATAAGRCVPVRINAGRGTFRVGRFYPGRGWWDGRRFRPHRGHWGHRWPA